jgi:uncharacterized protein
MPNTSEFVLPLQGLKAGYHEFQYTLDTAFFSRFEDSLIESGSFNVDVSFNRLSDFIELGISFAGTMRTACDRCLAEIDLPIEGDELLMIKFTEETVEDEADIIYLSPEEDKFDLAPILYEWVCLHIPLHRSYDCQNDDPRPCDMTTLQFITQDEDEPVDPIDGTTPKKDKSSETSDSWKSALDSLRDSFDPQ